MRETMEQKKSKKTAKNSEEKWVRGCRVVGVGGECFTVRSRRVAALSVEEGS